jgi:hypothetical protein
MHVAHSPDFYLEMGGSPNLFTSECCNYLVGRTTATGTLQTIEETSEVIVMSQESNSNDRQKPKPIHQPLRAEEVNLEEWEAQEEIAKHGNPTINPGDRIDNSKTLEEKSQQVAVNAPDITGDHIVVPTYFIVEDEEGEQKALHHVKDAEEISDVIRQARMDDEGNRTWR